MKSELKKKLTEKSEFIWSETLRMHQKAPGIRIASCLSSVEILTVLYYSILKVFPTMPDNEERDRVIASKGHGSISLYPILADLGFFPTSDLDNICRKGSIFGSIPDPIIPGYETVNGSLGHGLGVGCGMALGLKRKASLSSVYVLCGDGELYEGSNWEAAMFAPHHELDNLTLIVDSNKISMLNYCDKIVSHGSLKDKFTAFGWASEECDGHDIEQLHYLLTKPPSPGRPRVIIANTIKGHGVPELEGDHLSHVKSLSSERVDELLGEKK
jgi:transketolase